MTFPIDKVGKIQSVIFEAPNGHVVAIPWQCLDKKVVGTQLCLITDYGTHLPICRLSTIKKLVETQNKG